MLTFLRKSSHVLGMNARNLEYLRPYNLRRSREIADDKLLTKQVLLQAGIPTPSLFGVIRDRSALADFDFSELPSSFVLKPNFGYGGGGIKVFFGRDKAGNFISGSGEKYDEDYIRQHVANILDGNFSLHNVPDIAFFENRVQMLKLLKPYSFQGIPDIRVLVFNQVPVMAMLRLPTQQSKGKANLHQGGIGVGIDVASGVTTTAILRRAITGGDHVIEYVPKTRLLLSGVQLPGWDEVLRIASKSAEVVGLGYAGVDITYDREYGPQVIEVNARPGLSIQNANLSSLKDRLERVKGVKVKSIDHGIRLSKELFGGEVDQEVEDVSGRKIVGSIEPVAFPQAKSDDIEVEAKIDTGADSTAIDVDLAQQLGFGEAWETFVKAGYAAKMEIEDARRIERERKDEITGLHKDIVDVQSVRSSSGATVRPYVKIRFRMAGRIVVTRASIVDRTGLKYPMIIGKRDLKRFLVDVAK